MNFRFEKSKKSFISIKTPTTRMKTLKNKKARRGRLVILFFAWVAFRKNLETTEQKKHANMQCELLKI